MGGASRFITLLASPFSPVLRRPTCKTFRRLLICRISTAANNRRRHLHLLLPVNSTSPRKQLHTQAFNSSDSFCHPWPEWSHLLDALLSSESIGCAASLKDAFVVYEEMELSDEFIHHASLCLAFSRSRPELLSFLSRKDIEVIATNGTPFLFKSALDISQRLRTYLGLEAGEKFGRGDATLVDIMKYILSYARNPSERNNLYSRELVESSVRNLLRQITEASFGDPVQKLSTPQDHQFNFEYEETSRPLRPNVEMKRGDWICTKCSFMNFARNFKCLECEEPRPNNHLTGREWHCLQCSFYNYGRNLVCLRCDCQRPGTALANNVPSRSEWRFVEASSREITSLTAKNTPFKKDQKSMAEYGVSGGNTSDSSGHSKADDSSMKQKLDPFHGHFSPILLTSDDPKLQIDDQADTSTSTPFTSWRAASSTRDGRSKINVRKNVGSDRYGMASRASPKNVSATETNSKKDNNQVEKSEKWFRRVAELHNVKDLTSEISDEEFPEIMPMRKGENKFVVSKKKDRSLNSPASNRHAGTGQAMNSNFVPYVPFPPGYFAREDNPSVLVDKTPPSSKVTDNFSKKTDESSHFALDSTGSEPGQPMNSSGGKSLEVSLAGKEAENLDMSEEAKAERWFRRVAQMKDISELSQIPDEDFPSIMPMRKGVNRFVVSKRKTPLERRLTSQYRRNLPTVASEPTEKDNDTN